MTKRARWILASIIVMLLTAIVVLFWPAPQPATGPVPKPNGYDDFIRAGTLVKNLPVDYQKLSESELRPWVTTNQEALSATRAGLGKECRVPLEYSVEYFRRHFPELSGIKRLALSFIAEGRLAELERRTNDAALAYVDCIRLGHESSRGGLLVEHLVETALESMGGSKLDKIVPCLNAQECRGIIGRLEAIVANREPFADKVAVEHAWAYRAGGLRGRIQLMLTYRSFNPVEKEYRNMYVGKSMLEVARQSKLLLDLATRAYTLDHGHPPANQNELVPAYLKAPPITSATPSPRPVP
jgi:hypothetical protein